MSLAGKLGLRIEWDGNAVLGVEVKSTRPQAYRVLEGRSPDNAVQLVPMLYRICGKAQQAAAIAAVSAAQGPESPAINTLARAVACEAMQEHLWRLLLDWPKLLGLPQAQEQFVHWHGTLKAFAAGHGNAENFLEELHQVLLGVTHAEWQRLDSYARLSEWREAGRGLFAAVVAALELEESKLDFVGERTACALMPQWSAADVLRIYSGGLDREFAAMPRHEGKAMETGALACWQHTPLLQDVLHKRPGRLLARLIARVIDLLDSVEALGHENMSGRIQGIAASDGSGLAVVRTARGMLMHRVRIEAERVAEYLIVAPTEWNFHPQGALANGLVGLKAGNVEQLMETIRYYVLSLDPCVEYEIEVADA